MILKWLSYNVNKNLVWNDVELKIICLFFLKPSALIPTSDFDIANYFKL